jgi:hypothetical protein
VTGGGTSRRSELNMASILYKTDDLTNFSLLGNFAGPKDDVDRFLLMDPNDGLQIVVVDLDHQLFDEWREELDELLHGPVTPGTIVHTFKELDLIDLYRLEAKGVRVLKDLDDVCKEIRRRKFPPANVRRTWRLAG